MKKFLATMLALASLTSVAAFAACDNGQEQQSTVYVPEDGAVYVFSECVKFEVVSELGTSDLIDTAIEVYADATLTFSDGKLTMAYSLQSQDTVMTYEYKDDMYVCTILNDISAEQGVYQTCTFTVTAEQLTMYSHVDIPNNDGYKTEQFGELIFLRQN